jgi:HAD superfamily hydrolase (TIGR01509 family)
MPEVYHFHALPLHMSQHRTYEIYFTLLPSQLEAFPGVHRLFQDCREAGLRLAVASSADRTKVLANLEKIELPAEMWDAVVVGENVVHKKPAPDIFLFAAQAIGVEPAACAVVEDAVNGIQAAKAAGMRCIAVAQTFPAERLHEADVVRGGVVDVSLSDLISD